MTTHPPGGVVLVMNQDTATQLAAICAAHQAGDGHVAVDVTDIAYVQVHNYEEQPA